MAYEEARWLIEFEGKSVWIKSTLSGLQPVDAVLHKVWLDYDGSVAFIEAELRSGKRRIYFPPGLAWIEEIRD